MSAEYLYRGGKILALVWGKTSLPQVPSPAKDKASPAESRHAVIVPGVFPCIRGVRYEIGLAEAAADKKEINVIKTESLEFEGKKWTAFISVEPMAQEKLG